MSSNNWTVEDQNLVISMLKSDLFSNKTLAEFTNTFNTVAKVKRTQGALSFLFHALSRLALLTEEERERIRALERTREGKTPKKRKKKVEKLVKVKTIVKTTVSAPPTNYYDATNWATGPNAAKLLNCSPGYVTLLARMGHIERQPLGTRNWVYSLRDIAKINTTCPVATDHANRPNVRRWPNSPNAASNSPTLTPITNSDSTPAPIATNSDSPIIANNNSTEKLILSLVESGKLSVTSAAQLLANNANNQNR